MGTDICQRLCVDQQQQQQQLQRQRQSNTIATSSLLVDGLSSSSSSESVSASASASALLYFKDGTNLEASFRDGGGSRELRQELSNISFPCGCTLTSDRSNNKHNNNHDGNTYH